MAVTLLAPLLPQMLLVPGWLPFWFLIPFAASDYANFWIPVLLACSDYRLWLPNPGYVLTTSILFVLFYHFIKKCDFYCTFFSVWFMVPDSDTEQQLEPAEEDVLLYTRISSNRPELSTSTSPVLCLANSLEEDWWANCAKTTNVAVRVSSSF